MKHAALLPLLLLASFCAGGRGAVGTTSVPGHGAISIDIVPNPVVATRVSGSTFDFPFEVVVHESAGHPVDVTRVSANVFGPANVQIASETYDAARINQLGYSTHVPAKGELRYRFDPRRTVTDERLFGSVSADIRVDAHDETGTATTATTRVSVTRG
jgi:hypothetical protein